MNTISKLKYNKLLVGTDNKCYGGNQEWYKQFFQKKAGCGPVTASTITMYESKKSYSKSEFLNLLEDMWNYLTP